VRSTAFSCVICRTDRRLGKVYNPSIAGDSTGAQPIHSKGITMTMHARTWAPVLSGVALLLAAGCSSLKTPATADVAVSKAAVDNASQAGAAEFAPMEMQSAREKMALANQAMAAKNYKLAMGLASEAQADAKLAQGKANSTKARAQADALQDDIQILRVELERSSK
jgi:hypothetical protein